MKKFKRKNIQGGAVDLAKQASQPSPKSTLLWENMILATLLVLNIVAIVVIYFLLQRGRGNSWENGEDLWLGDEQIKAELNDLFLRSNLNCEGTEREKKFFLVEPTISEVLMNMQEEKEGVSTLLHEEKLAPFFAEWVGYDLLFFPLVDEHRTHWSLLVYSRAERTFFYYDSLQGYNYKRALKFIDALREARNPEISFADSSLEVVGVPQQTNTNDCGIYTVAFIEALIRNISDNTEQTEPWWRLTIKRDEIFQRVKNFRRPNR